MTSEGPKDLRDLVWLPAQIALTSGQSAAALLPARYAGSESAEDSAVRLGRTTEWRETAAGVEGLGRRIWTTDTGAEHDILSLGRLVMG